MDSVCMRSTAAGSAGTVPTLAAALREAWTSSIKVSDNANPVRAPVPSGTLAAHVPWSSHLCGQAWRCLRWSQRKRQRGHYCPTGHWVHWGMLCRSTYRETNIHLTYCSDSVSYSLTRRRITRCLQARLRRSSGVLKTEDFPFLMRRAFVKF